MKKHIFHFYSWVVAVLLPLAGLTQGIPEELQVQIKEKGFYEAKNAIEIFLGCRVPAPCPLSSTRQKQHHPTHLDVVKKSFKINDLSGE